MSIKKYNIVIFILLSTISIQIFAWTRTYTLPKLDQQSFPLADEKNKNYTRNIEYGLGSPAPFDMPVQTVASGNSFLIKIPVPPGTKVANLSTQSNTWSGSLMSLFDEDPVSCERNPDKLSAVCHISKLESPQGGFGGIIFGNFNSNTFSTEPIYKYLVFIRDTGTPFRFTTLNFGYIINDIKLYNSWVKAGHQIPWKTSTTLKIIEPTNGNITSNIGDINCGNGNKKCEYIATDTTSAVELTATPINDDFEFIGWSGDCVGNTNPLSLKMDTSKNCSAQFEPKPVKLTIDPVPENGFIINYINNDIIENENFFIDNQGKKIICRKELDFCLATYSQNSQAILVAVPDIGFTLDAWGSDCTGNTSYLALPMDEDKTCSAKFKSINSESTPSCSPR